MAKRRQGVLLWRDEPTAWLAGLGRKTRRDESQRGPFLDTWGAIGLPWGRGDKPAVSIVGSLDPERLDAALEGTGDGLAARFLYAWPGPAPYRSLRTLKPTREDEAVNALQRIARAVGTPEKPLVLSFEDRAVTAFDVSLERLHPEMLKAEGFMAGWLGKGRGTVARLAAVLALLDWTANRPSNAPPPTVITTQHLCAAWDLWERYYRPHAQAVFDRAGPADGDRQGKHKARQHARRVIGWIRARGVKEISREEVRREALSQRVNAAGADEVILALEQAGVLREVEVDEDYPSPGRPARRWQVNPALLAKPAAQIAESPSLPSAAGEVSSSYERRRGRKPRVESLRRIACANCGKANRRQTRRKRERQTGQNDQASRRSADLAGPLMSSSSRRCGPEVRARAGRSSCSSERERPARSES